MRTSAGLCLQPDVACGADARGIGNLESAGGREGQQLSPEVRLQRWLMRQCLRKIDVARELGVSLPAIVNFMAGKMKSERIRIWFVARGCPAELLDALHAERKSD